MLAVCIPFLAVPGVALGQTGVERILSYDVDLEVRRDGSLLVVERIDYDFGAVEKHGIFRDIPVRLTFDDRYDRVYPVEVVSIEGSPGTPDEYELENVDNLLRIKIGDPDRTISGRHVYTIVYSVEGSLNGFPGHDELYWNAVGAFWEVPIEAATVEVRAPGSFTQTACFAGPTGSTLPCSGSEVDGSTASFTQASLNPLEGLTVVAGLPKGIVPAPSPILEERWTLQAAFSLTPLSLGLSGGLLLLLFALLGRLQWRTGRDRRAVGSPVDVAYASAETDGQAVPLLERARYPVEYTPPDSLRPGQVGTLLDEVANPLDVTATIIDLAVRGHVRIEEIPKKGWFGKPDWRLVRLASHDELLPYERLLLDGVFEDLAAEETGEAALPTVLMSGLRKRFAERLKRVQEALYVDAAGRGWFSERPDKVRQKWIGRGWVLFLVGAGLVWLAAARTHLGLVPIPIALSGLLLVWGANRMPRRTAKGTGLVRRVQGFRRYIETAEVEEARFAERENLFFRYLPFAIVFGCTEGWARAFQGLEGETISNGWYVGSGSFTSHGFASSIDDFTVTTAGTISSTPSGSGSSGLGGGGSSGGGGGGGGGGSW